MNHGDCLLYINFAIRCYLMAKILASRNGWKGYGCTICMIPFLYRLNPGSVNLFKWLTNSKWMGGAYVVPRYVFLGPLIIADQTGRAMGMRDKEILLHCSSLLSDTVSQFNIASGYSLILLWRQWSIDFTIKRERH